MYRETMKWLAWFVPWDKFAPLYLPFYLPDKRGDLSSFIVFFETEIGKEHSRKDLKKLFDNFFFLESP